MIAICYSIHPADPDIKATLHKYTFEDQYIPIVRDWFEKASKLMAGLDSFHFAMLPDTERAEVEKAINCTGYIWNVHLKIQNYIQQISNEKQKAC